MGDDGEEAKDYAMRNMPAGRYNLLSVMTAELPDLPVYLDPIVSGLAVYLEYTIPPEYIVDEGEFEI